MADPEARRAALEALEQHANLIALHGSSEGRRIAEAQRAGAEAAELANADVDAWKSFQLAIGSGLVEAFHHLRLLDRGEAQEWRRRFREALGMPTGSPLTARPEGLRCSFCGRLEGEVGALVAGPAVYVCEGCVDLFNEIIRGRRAPRVG